MKLWMSHLGSHFCCLPLEVRFTFRFRSTLIAPLELNTASWADWGMGSSFHPVITEEGMGLDCPGSISISVICF